MGLIWDRLSDVLRWPREVDPNEPLARALWDHYRTGSPRHVEVHRSEGFTYDLDTAAFFALAGEQTRIDSRLLDLCEGSVLDVGAGAGRHSLELQQRGHDVTAIDISPGCARLLSARGVRHVSCIDVVDLDPDCEPFDTILFAMQSIGIVGTVSALEDLLRSLRAFIRPGGQILLDSSPPVDVPDSVSEGQVLLVPRGEIGAHVGEVEVAFTYRNLRGRPFGWLYIAGPALDAVARRAGWTCEIVDRLSSSDEYLARLRPLPSAPPA
jgi:SAM-dependent methyltransferase